MGCSFFDVVEIQEQIHCCNDNYANADGDSDAAAFVNERHIDVKEAQHKIHEINEHNAHRRHHNAITEFFGHLNNP